MAQRTWIVRKNEDADLADITATSLTLTGDIALGDDDKLVLGASSDVTLEWDTAATPDQLQLAPAADDTVLAIGIPAATQKSFDVLWYANEANGASLLTLDASANLIYTTGVDLQVKDDDLLVFGSGAGAAGDVQIEWDTAGTDALRITATADDTPLEIGNGTNSFDVTLFGNTAAAFAMWDASADTLALVDNVKLGFGNTSAAPDVYLLWDTNSLDLLATGAAEAFNIGGAAHLLNTTLIGTLTVGINGTGHDVTLYSATEGKSFLWDESEDKLVLTGGFDLTGNAALVGTLTVGVDDTGHDVKFFGATAGSYLFWDESGDVLSIEGAAGSFRVGTFASAAVGGTALSASKTAAVRFYADDGNAAIAAGNSVRTTVNRFLMLANNAGDVSIAAAQNQVKVGTATPGAAANVSGAWDYLEVGAAATIPGNYAAERAWVDCAANDVTVDTGAIMAGLEALCTFNGTITETGIVAGLYIGNSPAGSTNTWPQAIYINNAAAVFKFPSGTNYEAGVKIAGITELGAAASGVMKVLVGATTYYIPLYAAAQLAGE